LTSNINALKVQLSDEDIKEIEAASLFVPGYPYTLLTGGGNEPLSTTNPGAAVTGCGTFVGVAQPKAIPVVHDA
jgi:hypothetical protein